MPSLSEQVAGVLEDDVAQRIRFRCGRTQVYGRGYLAVARALRRPVGSQHRIQCEFNTNLEAVGCGNYDESVGPNRVNVMKLPFRNIEDVRHKAVAVHEATHALQDYHRLPMALLDAECAAYVAQMLYVKITDPAVFPYANDALGTAALSPNALMLFSTAYQIASRLHAESGSRDVAPREIEALKDDLLRIRFYRVNGTNRVRFDGI